MDLIAALREEHELIERVVLAFHGWACETAAGRASPEDGAAFLRFFRRFAGSYHHAREEDTLFTALVHETEVPADRGPLHAIAFSHADMAGQLDRIAAALDGTPDVTAVANLVETYTRDLLNHIDAENSVLFPEGAERLRRAGVRSLEGRAPTDDELHARDEGIGLAARHAGREPRRMLRGEGCIHCTHYGERCDGVERSWWSPQEWEDFFLASANGD